MSENTPHQILELPANAKLSDYLVELLKVAYRIHDKKMVESLLEDAKQRALKQNES